MISMLGYYGERIYLILHLYEIDHWPVFMTDESEKSILHLTQIMSQSFDNNTFGLHG